MNGTLHLPKKLDKCPCQGNPTMACAPISPIIPADWVKGQLLNVRSAGDFYNVTLLGEEYDPRHPERCLQFPHSWDAQQFISLWYSRSSHDPRAL